MYEVFSEFAFLLIISAAAGALAMVLRQPILIAYIAVGIVAGPAVLGLVKTHDQINLLAQVGVAVLLFVVGLKLDLRHIRHMGPVALATGLGQIGFTIVFSLMLTMLLGLDTVAALYVSVALTFSSTIIIIKLLSDKYEIESLHGRIAVGLLIVQDLAVVLAMMIMSAFGQAGKPGALTVLISIAVRVAAASVLLYGLMRYVLPKLVSVIARSQELLLIFAVAWGTSLAALGEWGGFSKEAGAFLAGFSLASTAYRDAISARLSGIRDFLLLFFFIDLGSKLNLAGMGNALWPAMALSIFVLLGKPFIVMVIMGWMGYRKRTGFLTGLTVAQVSEFSIIFIAMGISLGHIGDDTLSLTTLVGLVTIALSSYMILYSHRLYELLAPWLGIFERRSPHREADIDHQEQIAGQLDVIVFGLGRYGGRLVLGLQQAGLTTLGVDFDPEIVRNMTGQGLHSVRYGDGTDGDFLDHLPLGSTSWIISTLPDISSNLGLLNALQNRDCSAEVAFVVRVEEDILTLKQAGAPTVLYPIHNAVDHAIEILTDIMRR